MADALVRHIRSIMDDSSGCRVKIFGDVVAVRSVNPPSHSATWILCRAIYCRKLRQRQSCCCAHAGGLRGTYVEQILLDGEDITAVPPCRQPVNMMFQSYALFPHMTVEANGVPA